jgi:cytochrome c556
MIWTHALAAILAALIAFGGGWKVNGWRLGEQINEMKSAQQQAVADATREARAQESRRYQEIQNAQAKSAQRAADARRASDAARTAGDGLRDDIAAGLRASEESAAACHQHAASVSRLLSQCEADYRGMATAAQGHAGDVMLLLDAWPK